MQVFSVIWVPFQLFLCSLLHVFLYYTPFHYSRFVRPLLSLFLVIILSLWSRRLNPVCTIFCMLMFIIYQNYFLMPLLHISSSNLSPASFSVVMSLFLQKCSSVPSFVPSGRMINSLGPRFTCSDSKWILVLPQIP